MKTKHFIISTILISSLFISPIQAQGVYMGLGGGYGFAAGKQSFFDDYKTTVSATSTSQTNTSHPFSLGKGVNAGLYAGYMFNKNVGAELGVSYLIGSKNVFTDEYTNTGPFPSSSKTEMTWKGRMIRLVPTIRMTAGENKLHPYMKAGLIIGVGGKVYDDTHSESTSSSTTTVTERSWEYYGGTSLGFHGAIGLNYMVSDKIGIFAEVAGNYQNFSVKKGSMTKYTIDGVDQMSSLDKIDKEVEFVDSYTYDSSATPNVNQPDQSTKFFMPFSSIGVNLGLHISFGGKTE
ncbi:MAG TPA: outer membrane beta-barrel protein [Bacteroidia bacterium]|nr:outer membrane beta-barrel protein [Bacteroidia bacterium]